MDTKCSVLGHAAKLGTIGLWLVGVGCTSNDPSMPPGNETLGVVDFQIEDSADSTKIVGVDAQNQAVATLELIHGHFIGSNDDTAGQDVVGRKLSASVPGAPAFEWETPGYSDTSAMPILPHEFGKVLTFLADPHVKPILGAWKIGWVQAPHGDGAEVAYYNGTLDLTGTGAPWCSYDYYDGYYCTGYAPWGASWFNGGSGGGLTLPIQSGTIADDGYDLGDTTPVCNGGTFWTGLSVWFDALDGGYNGMTADGNVVAQCCGTETSGHYAVKACAVEADGGTYHTACGDTSNKCSPCFTPIAFNSYCNQWSSDTHSTNSWGVENYDISHDFQ